MWFDQYPIALSIDIETLSLRSNAHVLQIGFCVANIITGEWIMRGKNLWIHPKLQEGRHIDPNTVTWWLDQSADVKKMVLAPDEFTTPKDAHWILKKVVASHEGLLVWANPAMFDLPILGDLWKGDDPWTYRQEADLQTLIRVFDGDKQQEPQGLMVIAHDGASDAEYQMHYLMNIVSMLRQVQSRG